MEAVKESELKKTLMIVAIAFFSLMIFKEIAYEIRKAQAINALNDSLEQMSKSFDKIKKNTQAQKTERERQEVLRKTKTEQQQKALAQKNAIEQRAREQRKIATQREKARQIEVQRFVMKKELEFEKNYKAAKDCEIRFVQCTDEKKRAKIEFFERQGIKDLYDEAKKLDMRKKGFYIN